MLLLPSSTFSSLFHRRLRLGTACPLGYRSVDGPLPPHHPTVTPLASQSGPAPKLYFNCTIITAENFKSFKTRSFASAFVVQGGKFEFVGSLDEARERFGSSAIAIDLQGDTIMPGFIDAHLHLINGGFSINRLNLVNVTSKKEFVELISRKVQKSHKGHWIIGSNWDERRWGGEEPDARWIDAVTVSNPTLLVRSDGHVALANQLALKAANITGETIDPVGGTIFRFRESNTPNGLLADAAISLVVSKIPKPSLEERVNAVKSAQQHALAHGITAVHDMGRIAFQDGDEAAMDDLEKVYMKMADEESLRVRVYSFVPLSQWRRLAERVRHIGNRHPKGRLTWGGVKEFYDGSLGARTALMVEPYADGPPNLFGLKTVNDTIFGQQIQAAHASHLQIAVHAIGDRAVEEVLDAYIKLIDKGDNTLRHRIEHVQHISGSDVAQRLASYGIAVTTNPSHYLSDRDILLSRLGADRARRSFALKTMSTSKVANAFASDWPVAPIDPLLSLRAATLEEREESVEADEACISQTAAGAFAGHRNDIGIIREGARADFVRLSSSPFAKDVHVLETYMDGECEFGCLETVNESRIEDVQVHAAIEL